MDDFIGHALGHPDQRFIIPEVVPIFNGMDAESYYRVFRGKTFPANVQLPFNYVKEAGESRPEKGYLPSDIAKVAATNLDDSVALIGSRGYQTNVDKYTYDFPVYAQKRLENIQIAINEREMTTRSGGAQGSDAIATRLASKKEIFIPWKDNKMYPEDGIVASDFPNWNEAESLVKNILGEEHWNRLSRGGKALQTRNAYQVLGADLNSPSKFVVVWRDPSIPSSGTDTAIKIARANNIPVFNIYYGEDYALLSEALDMPRDRGYLPMPGNGYIPYDVPEAEGVMTPEMTAAIQQRAVESSLVPQRLQMDTVERFFRGIKDPEAYLDARPSHDEVIKKRLEAYRLYTSYMADHPEFKKLKLSLTPGGEVKVGDTKVFEKLVAPLKGENPRIVMSMEGPYIEFDDFPIGTKKYDVAKGGKAFRERYEEHYAFRYLRGGHLRNIDIKKQLREVNYGPFKPDKFYIAMDKLTSTGKIDYPKEMRSWFDNTFLPAERAKALRTATTPDRQVASTADKTLYETFASMSAEEARAYGRDPELSALIKPEFKGKEGIDSNYNSMRRVLSQKFSIPKYRELLLATGNRGLIHENFWGDKFWGTTNGDGKNQLGSILERIRSDLRDVSEAPAPVVQSIPPSQFTDAKDFNFNGVKRTISVVNTSKVNPSVLSDPSFVYVGRNMKSSGGIDLNNIGLGNPFSIKEMGSAEAAVEAFDKHLTKVLNSGGDEDSKMYDAFFKLVDRTVAGENLTFGCWCKPGACHADVIRRRVAEYAEGRLRPLEKWNSDFSNRIIDSFRGKYEFLSNFHEEPGLTFRLPDDPNMYKTVEHAYQAAKTFNPIQRSQIAGAGGPGAAKSIGKHVSLSEDWGTRKFEVMYDLLKQKFSHPELKKMLLETDNAELIEGNHWGDKVWGVSDGVGENHLGKLLTRIREELRGAEPSKVEPVVEEVAPVIEELPITPMRLAGEVPGLDADAAYKQMVLDGKISLEDYVFGKTGAAGYKHADGTVELMRDRFVGEVPTIHTQMSSRPAIADKKVQDLLYNMTLEALEEYRELPAEEALELFENNAEKLLKRYGLAPELDAFGDTIQRTVALLKEYVVRQADLHDFGMKTIEMPDYDTGIKLQELLNDELIKFVQQTNNPDISKGMYIERLSGLKERYYNSKAREEGYNPIAKSLSVGPEIVDHLNKYAHEFFIYRGEIDAAASRATAALMATSTFLGAIGLHQPASGYSGIVDRFVNTAARELAQEEPSFRYILDYSKDDLRKFVYENGLVGQFFHDRFTAINMQHARMEEQLHHVGSLKSVQAKMDRILRQSEGHYDEILTPLEKFREAQKVRYESGLLTIHPEMKDAYENYQLSGDNMIQNIKNVAMEAFMDPKGAGVYNTYKGYTKVAQNGVELLQHMARYDDAESLENLARLLKSNTIGQMLFIHKSMNPDFDPRALVLLKERYGIKYEELSDHYRFDMRNTNDVLEKLGPLKGRLTRFTEDELSPKFVEAMDAFYHSMQTSSKAPFPVDWADAPIMRIDDEKIVPYLVDGLKYLTPEEAIAYAADLQDSGRFGFSFLSPVEELSTVFDNKLMESPLRMAISSATSLLLHHDAKPRFLNLFFNEGYQISNLFGTNNPREILKLFKDNRDLVPVIVKSDFSVQQLPMNNLMDVKTALMGRAIVMPYNTFIKTYNALDSFKLPKILEFMERNLTAPYKAGVMSTIGLPFRNLVDNNLKLLMYANGDFDAFGYIPTAYKYMNRFQEMALEMKTLTNGDVVAEYLRRQTHEDQMIFFLLTQAKDGAVSGAPMDVYLDITKAERLARELRSGSTDKSSLIQKISWGNPITQAALYLQNNSEQHWRLAAYLYDMNRGKSASEIFQRVAEYFIDYSHKTAGMQYLNAMMPFSMFTLKNTMLWASHALDDPWILRTLLDASEKSWNQAEDDRRTGMTAFEKDQRLSGNIKLGNAIVKINPSFYDAMMAIPNLLRNPLGRVNPVIKNVVSLMSGNVDEVQLPWETNVKRVADVMKATASAMQGTGEMGLNDAVPSLFGEFRTYPNRYGPVRGSGIQSLSTLATYNWRGTSYTPQPKYVFNSVYYAAKMAGRRGYGISSTKYRRNFYNAVWGANGKPRFTSTSLEARIRSSAYRYKEIRQGKI